MNVSFCVVSHFYLWYEQLNNNMLICFYTNEKVL